MPDPIDTLRNDLASMMYAWGNRVLSWEGVCEHDHDERDDMLAYADDVLTHLAAAALDPVRLRAILELVGLEVREGWLYRITDPSPAIVRFDMPPNDLMSDGDVLVCRVRPQGEQTDG